uniref:Uncharacterized protein n=1 Tax=viral metagenome TaxID=1070528 RepID=A0A6C0BNR2_9ZZZZ
MSSLSIIPEDVLYNIAEYSNVVPEGLSSKYILQEMLNLHPTVNLGKELILGNIHRYITLLSPDFQRIVNILGEHNSTDYKITDRGKGLELIVGESARCSLSKRKFKLMYKSFYRYDYDHFSIRLLKGSITLRFNIPGLIPEGLEMICDIYFRQPEHIIASMKIRSVKEHIPSNVYYSLSRADPSRTVEAIDQLRTIPGAISRIIKYCHDFNSFLKDPIHGGCTVEEIWEMEGIALSMIKCGTILSVRYWREYPSRLIDWITRSGELCNVSTIIPSCNIVHIPISESNADHIKRVMNSITIARRLNSMTSLDFHNLISFRS